MTRQAERKRRTKETDIDIRLDLDAASEGSISTGVGFFDHMLTLFAAHGFIGLSVAAKGDLEVDAHHTIEDVGICLGECLRQALGDKSGIRRYGTAYVPMDEALVRTVIDLSGRSFCHYAATIRAKKVGDFDTDLVEDFLQAFAGNARLTLHVDMIRGRNGHHIVEAVFKSLGQALRQAVELTGRPGVPSTKGTLSE